MQDEGLGSDSPLTRAATVTRRAFGQALGMAAVAGTVPGLSGTAWAQPAKTAIAAGAGDELCDLSAIELVARMRRKQVSAREVMTAHLARIERVNPKVNAVVTLVAERAMADAARADERLARGEASRRSARPAGGAQGSGRYGRHPHDPRVAVLPRQRAGQGRAHRDAHPRGRGDHLRQDEHAGVRRRLADVQQRLRGDAQSLRRHQDLRRQLRRCGGRAGVRHGPDRGRQRHGRLAAQSRRVLQRRRASAVARPRARKRGQLVAAVGVRPDGQVCCRRRALPERDGGAGPGEPALDRGGRRPVSRASRTRLQGCARGMVAWSRRHPVRTGDPADRRREPPRLRGARVHRRGGRARLRRRGRGVPGTPVHRQLPAVCAAGPGASRVGERHDQVRGRRGRAHERRGHRTRAGATDADVRPEPAVLRTLRLLRSSGHPGLALRCERALSDADCRNADGDRISTGCDPAGTSRSCRTRRSRCRRDSRRRDCRSGSRSSAGTVASGACCRWRTRSSRPRNTARGAQQS